MSGLPPTFWWLWAGTLVNRAGAFVLPFLAFYLTDELDLTPSFVGLVLGAFGLGSIVAAWSAACSPTGWAGGRCCSVSQLSTAATLVAARAVTTGSAAVLVLVRRCSA